MRTQENLNGRMQYEFVIQGILPEQWQAWYKTKIHIEQIDPIGQETSRFSLSIVDQAELHGVLNRIRDLNLTLVSVHQIG